MAADQEGEVTAMDRDEEAARGAVFLVGVVLALAGGTFAYVHFPAKFGAVGMLVATIGAILMTWATGDAE